MPLLEPINNIALNITSLNGFLDAESYRRHHEVIVSSFINDIPTTFQLNDNVSPHTACKKNPFTFRLTFFHFTPFLYKHAMAPKDSVSDAIEKYKPLVSEVSMGGVLGYCSGEN